MPAFAATNQKMRYRMMQIVKYRVNGRLSDTKIAELVGLTPSGLATLIKNPDYMEMEEAAYEGKLSEIDRKLAEDDDALQKEFKQAIPAALTALVETVVQRRDLRARLVAAKEILDRDPERRFLASGGARQVEIPGGSSPTLSADLMASLNAEGAKTVGQLQKPGTTVTTVKVETTNVMPPEAGKHNA